MLRIRADFPEGHHGSNVVVTVPVPKSTSSASGDMSSGAMGQSFEHVPAESHVLWKIKRITGGMEETLRIRLVVSDSQSQAVRKEIGPVKYVCFNLL